MDGGPVAEPCYSQKKRRRPKPAPPVMLPIRGETLRCGGNRTAGRSGFFAVSHIGCGDRKGAPALSVTLKVPVPTTRAASVAGREAEESVLVR